MTTALGGSEGSASRPGRFLPPGKTRYPLYRRLGGPQGGSGQVQNILPSTGIRTPDRPVCSQSLYRLSYPAHTLSVVICKMKTQWLLLSVASDEGRRRRGSARRHETILASSLEITRSHLSHNSFQTMAARVWFMTATQFEKLLFEACVSSQASSHHVARNSAFSQNIRFQRHFQFITNSVCVRR